MRSYALAVILAATACEPAEDEGGRTASTTAELSVLLPTPAAPTIPSSSPPSRADACSGRRQIGVNPRPGHPCPSARDRRWKKINLFPHAQSTSELAKYCVYDWTEETSPPVVTRLPRAGFPAPSDWLESDCEVVSTYGHPYETRNAASLETAFLEQVEFEIGPPTTNTPTKVVVVDTAVDGPFPNGADGVDDHGRAMATVIRKLACPAGVAPCLATVSTQLAMPLVRTPHGLRANRAHGGFLGRPSDIAAAIHRGLHHALVTPGANRVVINLSLGWEPPWGGALSPSGVSGLPAPVQMVFWAITEARCEGAIVVAAAGNAAGGPDADSGFVYPAGWETQPKPDVPTCLAFGGGPPPSGRATYLPLVYAAGAVDGRDQILMNSRPDGASRLLAPSDHVVVSDGPGYTSASYTGTSVSAAVASAMAAMMWTYRTGLSADEVMEEVYQAAVDLSVPADVCLSSPCATVRRLSACRTLERACVAPRCAGAVPCGAPNPGRDARARGFDLSYPQVSTTTSTGTTNEHAPFAPCSNVVFSAGSGVPENPCPFNQYYTSYAVRYATPQPHPIGCKHCVLKNSVLYIGVSDELDAPVSDPVITIVTESGQKYGIKLDNVDVLLPGETAVVEVDYELTDDVAKGTIEFVQDGGYSTHDVLLIE